MPIAYIVTQVSLDYLARAFYKMGAQCVVGLPAALTSVFSIGVTLAKKVIQANTQKKNTKNNILAWIAICRIPER